MSNEVFHHGDESGQDSEDGGPASKKANISESDTVQIKVLIPSGAVGALIGKGGETMRNLKNDTGCRVQMSKNQEVYHGTHERICLVKGKVSSVMQVIAAILKKIQEKIDTNMPSDIYDLKGIDRCKEMKFVVPNTSAGMVIGKSGASVKEIREQTTANIQVYPKAGSEEAKQSVEHVITVGHENNDVLMDAIQRVLEKVVADPLHSQAIDAKEEMEDVVESLQAMIEQRGKQVAEVQSRTEKWARYEKDFERTFTLPVDVPPKELAVNANIPFDRITERLKQMIAGAEAKLNAEKKVQKALADRRVRLEKASGTLSQWVDFNLKECDQMLEKIKEEKIFVQTLRKQAEKI